jgi:hypothetical protein
LDARKLPGNWGHDSVLTKKTPPPQNGNAKLAQVGGERGSRAALSPATAPRPNASLHCVFRKKRMVLQAVREPANRRHKEASMPDDGTVDRRPFKPWAEWGRKQFKEEVEEAWQAKTATSDKYEVVIQVEGNNPISGYLVVVRPS